MSRLDYLIYHEPEGEDVGFWPWDLYYQLRDIVGQERIEELILIMDQVRMGNTTCLVFQHYN